MNNNTSNWTGNSILGQNIKNIRKELNLTQEQFAEKIGINSQFLSQVETGKIGISIDTAISICKVANCSSVRLFDKIIESANIIEKYDLLNERDKSVVSQMISFLLDSK